MHKYSYLTLALLAILFSCENGNERQSKILIGEWVEKSKYQIKGTDSTDLSLEKSNFIRKFDENGLNINFVDTIEVGRAEYSVVDGVLVYKEGLKLKIAKLTEDQLILEKIQGEMEQDLFNDRIITIYERIK